MSDLTVIVFMVVNLIMNLVSLYLHGFTYRGIRGKEGHRGDEGQKGNPGQQGNPGEQGIPGEKGDGTNIGNIPGMTGILKGINTKLDVIEAGIKKDAKDKKDKKER